MARIAGVNIPDNKHTVISLTYIYGVGRTRAQEICAATGVNPAAKIKDLSDEQVELLVHAQAGARLELLEHRQRHQAARPAAVQRQHAHAVRAAERAKGEPVERAERKERAPRSAEQRAVSRDARRARERSQARVDVAVGGKRRESERVRSEMKRRNEIESTQREK